MSGKMAKAMVAVFGSKHEREMKRMLPQVHRINQLEPIYRKMSDHKLKDQTRRFRERLDRGAKLDDILPEAFATVREASVRTLGMRHFDVQLIGGIALHNGKIAEMKTGEGKTLVATLALYLNGLERRGCSESGATRRPSRGRAARGAGAAPSTRGPDDVRVETSPATSAARSRGIARRTPG